MRAIMRRGQVAFYGGFSLLAGLAWSLGSVTRSATPWDMAIGVTATSVLLSLAGIPCFVIVSRAVDATRGGRASDRIRRVVLAVLVGAIASGACYVALPIETVPVVHLTKGPDWRFLGGAIRIYLVYAALLTAILLNSEQALAIEVQGRAADIARAHQLRESDELRLRQLQTQIEPHFVVNVLANVKELDRRKEGNGRGLLRTLSQYLALALSPGRLAQPTVRDELALTHMYLDMLAVRMGARLKVEIDVPDRLRDCPIPPLMLGTLVENAIKHGIGPRDRGGRICVQYRDDGQDLLIRVVDDGVGFRGETGSGIGLVNTRARLAALYGDRARLELRENPGGGVVASLRIPREVA